MDGGRVGSQSVIKDLGVVAASGLPWPHTAFVRPRQGRVGLSQQWRVRSWVLALAGERAVWEVWSNPSSPRGYAGKLSPPCLTVSRPPLWPGAKGSNVLDVR